MRGLTAQAPVSGTDLSRAFARLTSSPGRLVDALVEAAPHLPVRDLATLQAHHRPHTGEALADALVAAAERATAAVGAAGGALAAAEWAAPPLLASAPVQVAAETLAVVLIELKLVAELHEVYGAAAPGPPASRGAAYLGAWARRRGVDPLRPQAAAAALTGTARRELRQRVIRRLARNGATFLPLLAGSVAGGHLNRRDTRRLAHAVRTDLRRR